MAPGLTSVDRPRQPSSIGHRVVAVVLSCNVESSRGVFVRRRRLTVGLGLGGFGWWEGRWVGCNGRRPHARGP
jgi:hypothetical protein